MCVFSFVMQLHRMAGPHGRDGHHVTIIAIVLVRGTATTQGTSNHVAET